MNKNENQSEQFLVNRSISLPSIQRKNKSTQAYTNKPFPQNKYRSECTKKGNNKKDVIDLQEINRKLSVDNIIKIEHQIQRKKMTLNPETIDLWKLKHHQSRTPQKKQNKQTLPEPFVRKKKEKKYVEVQLYRKNSFQRMHELKSIAQITEFQIHPVNYLKISKKDYLEELKKQNLVQKLKLKIPLPHLPPKKQEQKPITVEYEYPSKWDTGRQNYIGDEESFVKSELNQEELIDSQITDKNQIQ